MIGALLIAFLVAKLRGDKIGVLFKTWVIYPIFFWELFYWYMQFAIMRDNYSFVQYSSVFEKMYLLTFVILIIKYKQYYSAIIGSVCIFVGTALNKIVINANGGKMPVFPSLSYITGYVDKSDFNKFDHIHMLGDESVRLKFLTDIFDTGYSILSIGDIFIKGFIFILILNTIKQLNVDMQDNQLAG